MNKEHENFACHTWNIGDKIEFEADSPFLNTTYHSQVINVNRCLGVIQIRMPKDEGKLVLVPVGTLLWVKTPLGRLDQYYVVDRTSGDNRCLVLQLAANQINYLRELEVPSGAKILTVASGKGGVGKTTLAINLGLALAKKGKKVCILDAALGTANVDVALSLFPRHNLIHVITGQFSLMEVLVEAAPNLLVIPGCSGSQIVTELNSADFNVLAHELRNLLGYIDVLIIDTLSGISANTTDFLIASQNGLIVTSPDPCGITDTYALIKALRKEATRPVKLNLVVNNVLNKPMADEVAEKLQFSTKRFLDIDLGYAGFILSDYSVSLASFNQTAVIESDSHSITSHAIYNLAEKLFTEDEQVGKPCNGRENLLTRLKRITPSNRA